MKLRRLQSGWLRALLFVAAAASVSAANGQSAKVSQQRAREFVQRRQSSPGAESKAASAAASARDQHSRLLQDRQTRAERLTAGSGVMIRTPEVNASPAAMSLSAPWLPAGPAQVNTAAYGLVTGRVSSVALDPADSTGNTVYLGTAGGGVWKSTNAAGPASSVSFTPLTDTLAALSANAGSTGQASLSIGAVTVEPGGTGVILAGTGDPNDAADSYYGVGILRSADSGQTWSLIKLSQDGAGGAHTFAGEGFAGFAWSGTTGGLVVAAVSNAAEGTTVNASTAGASVRGLFYSTDSGQSWSMATLRDGTTTVQSGSSDFSTYEGNAATAVVWDNLRQRFYAAVRYHGYYESADGITFTRLLNQPGTALTAAACPARAGLPGLSSCPIFRGALAAEPVSGDLFALTVDGSDNDVGLYRDICGTIGGSTPACASSTVLWAARLPSTALDTSTGAIEQGDYNLTLAAVPAATALSQTDTLLFVGATDLFRCRLSDGCVLRNTTNTATGCAAPAHVAPAQHGIGFQTVASNAAAPLLYFANDGGLWRSTDGVNQQAASCSADDPTHFDNLNGGLGSLAEVAALSVHPTDGGIALAALGALGSAASTASASSATLQTVWTQMGTGESASVAIDQANPLNWLLQSGYGVAVHRCTRGAACTADDFSGPPAIGSAQVAGDTELADAPLLLDPALNSNVLVGTCRIYRGPTTGGGTWSAVNAISSPLTGPANTVCTTANGLIRSLGAGGVGRLTGAAQTSGSPVLYAGLAGSEAAGSTATAGHFFRYTSANLATGATAWTDATIGTVTNDATHGGRFNPFGFDVSSIAVDPHDPSGLTVYATVQGFGTPGVYRSTDGAASWLSITANLPNAPANAVLVDPNDPKIVYVALDTGVYVATDVTTCGVANAQCWSAYGTALPGSPVTTLVASTGFAVPGSTAVGVLRAGTYGRGVWQIPLLTAGAAAMPSISFTPGSLTFDTQSAGTTSAPQTVTVTNAGSAALVIARVFATAGWIETDTCTGQTIATGSSCAAQVSFAPTAVGSQSGSLEIDGNVLGGYALLPLSGNAAGQTAVLLSPSSLVFADTAVGSFATAKTVTVTNNGGTSTTLQTPSVSGDFTLGTATCLAGPLAAGSSCTVAVGFAPTGSGPRSGVLTLADSTGTHSVPLSGNGLAGHASLTPAALSFAATGIGQTSAAMTATLTNSGNGPLQVGSITASGDFTETDTCANSTLASAQSCTITLHFVPLFSGTRTGTLVVTSNSDGAAGSTATVSLTGAGQSAFSIQLTPSVLNFGSISVGTTSPVQNVTISNTGSGSGSLGNPGVVGDFVIRANTCGASLATQTGCTVSIAFQPTAGGTRTGVFTLASDVGTSTATLSGTGTSAATDTLAPQSLTFAATSVGTTSAPQSVILTNSGDVALTLVAARITSGVFSAVNGCGPSLAAHSSCSIQVTFAPTAVGAITGTLEVDDVQRTQIVPLTGSGQAGPGLSLAPAALSFGAVGVGTATAPQMLTLSNNGGVTVQVSGITVVGDFGLTPGGTCATGSTLAAGASCTLSLAFAPTASGIRTGSLTVTGTGTTQKATLSGIGIDFTFASNGPSSVTVSSGKSAIFPMLLTPAVGSALPLTFSCTGAPSYSKCLVTSTYTDLSATNTVTATLSTGVAALEIPRGLRPGPGRAEPLLAALLPWGLLSTGALAWSLRRRRSLTRLLSIAGIALLLTVSGCGSGRHTADVGEDPGSGSSSGSGTGATVTTPSGTYTIVVSASAAGLTRQVPVTLVVQ